MATASAFTMRSLCRSSSILRARPVLVVASRRHIQEETGGKELVYSGMLSAQIKKLKVFTLGTSVAGIVMQPMIFKELGNVSMGLVAATAATLGIFTFCTPFMIHQITKKYVIECFYDSSSDTYTATTLSFILQKKQHTFKVADIHIPDIPGMFTSMKVGNTPLFLTPEGFYSREHYLRMMKLDQPIDLGMSEDKRSNSETS